MNEENTVDTGTTEDETDDESQDDVSSLSDSDLAALIEGEKQPDDEKAGNQPQPAKKDEPNEARPTEPEKVTDKQADKPAFVDPNALPAQPTQEEFEKLKQRLQAQANFLDRRSQEIGELRKQNRELVARLQREAEEIQDDNPRLAVRYDRAIEDAQRREQQLASEQAQAQRERESLELVPKYVPQEEFDVEAMRLELKEDNLPEDFISDFVKNPHAACFPETLIHLAKRAHYGKHLRAIVPIVQALKAENDQLKAQIKTKGEKVVRGIQQAAKAKPVLTAHDSAADQNGRAPSVDFSAMSDAELKAFLEQNS